MKLSEALRKIEEEIESIPNIRCGGCGFFAVILAEKLIELDITEFEFLVTGPIADRDGFLTATHVWLNIPIDPEWCNETSAVINMLQVFKPNVYIKEHVQNGKRFDAIEQYYFLPTLKRATTRKAMYWNRAFDRKYIKTIKKIVSKWLKKENLEQ